MAASMIKEKIIANMKDAMRMRTKEPLGTIRLILAAVKQKEIDERIVLTDEHVIAILSKMIKQRRDSMMQYENGNRPDLVKKEAQEIQIIQTFLPRQLSEVEMNQAIESAILVAQAQKKSDIGKVMIVLKEKYLGQIDMAVASYKIKERLQG